MSTQLLYIKVSDGSVWGYADDGTGGGPFPDMTNVVLPEDNQILNYITTTNDGVYTKYSDSVALSSDLSLADDAPVNEQKSINIVNWYPGTIVFNSRYINSGDMTKFTLAFWVKSTGNGCLLVSSNDSGTWSTFYSDRCNVKYSNDYGPGIHSYSNLDSWHYVAICGDRDANIITTYVDGASIGTSVYIGLVVNAFREDTATTRVFDVIMTNHVMFTGNFTPPISRVFNIE
jgi:hypothetical protein